MSKYTTEVRFICESEAGLDESSAYRGIDTVITSAMPKIFSFSYPIFDETYRNVLQKKILKHFYTREIGLETYGLWKLKLDTRLNEIMPYYNRLYESELLEYNPLYSVDLTRVRKNVSNTSSATSNTNESTLNTTSNKISAESNTISTSNENSKTSSETNSLNTTNIESNVGSTTTDANASASGLENGSVANENTNLYSDTPQGQISHLEDKTYLTNATQVNDNTVNHNETSNSDTSHSHTDSNGISNTNTNTDGVTNVIANDNTNTNTSGNTNVTENDISNTSANSTGNTINTAESLDDYIERVTGYENKDIADLVLKFRNTFLNIDMMIINDLEDLFMQLW